MQKDSELTDQIIGPKGLRQQIIDEQEKIARIDEELKNVVSRQTNSRVETELLLSRRSAASTTYQGIEADGGRRTTMTSGTK